MMNEKNVIFSTTAPIVLGFFFVVPTKIFVKQFGPMGGGCGEVSLFPGSSFFQPGAGPAPPPGAGPERLRKVQKRPVPDNICANRFVFFFHANF